MSNLKKGKRIPEANLWNLRLRCFRDVIRSFGRYICQITRRH